MKDYHAKPVLAVRVSADVQDWARGEAKRRDEGIGDFVEGVLAAERERASKPATPSRAPVAAENQQPQTARRHALTCKCGTCRPK